MLPPLLVGCVMLTAAVAEWPARNVAGQATPYRYIYSAAAAILAGQLANACITAGLRGGAAYLLAAVAFLVGNIACVALAVTASGDCGALRTYARPSSYKVDVYTFAVAAIEIALLQVHLPLVWLSLPAAIGFQHYTVRGDLRAVGSDSEWSPMTEEAWLIAAREVVAALPVAAIMRVQTTDPCAVSFVAWMQAGCDAIVA